MAARRACNSAPRRSASMAAMESASVECSISLSATASPLSESCVRYTSAIPPRPSLRTISYLPILRLAGAIMASPRGWAGNPGGTDHRLLWSVLLGQTLTDDERRSSVPLMPPAPSLLRLSRWPCRSIRPRRGAHRPQEEVKFLDAVGGRRFQHAAVEN